MRNYMMVLIAVLFMAGDFACNKMYQKKAGTSLVMGLKFNSLLGLFTGIIFLIPILIQKGTVSCTAFSLILASLMTVFVTTYNIIGFRIMKSGSMALYTLFLMTGGMMVPYVWGLFFLQEEFSLQRTVGLLFMIIAVVWANYAKKQTAKLQVCLCVLVFFLNGFVSVISKMHQVEETLPHISATEFVMLSGFCRFVLAGVLYLLVRKRANREAKETRGLPVIIAASAVCSGLSYLLQLLGAQNLPATVLYPLVTGGGMVFTALAGVIFFKEKPSRRVVLGVVVCFLATFLFL